MPSIQLMLLSNNQTVSQDIYLRVRHTSVVSTSCMVIKQVSVAPTSNAIPLTEHAKGSISDLTIFHVYIGHHCKMFAKRHDEGEIQDPGVMSKPYPANWDIFFYKMA